VLIGGLLFLRLKVLASARLILGSTALVGLAYIGLAAVDSLAAACAFSVLGGIGNGNQWVSVMTYLQESTPPDLQARMAGLLESLGAAVPGVGFLAGGALTALTSPPTTYAIAGAGVLMLVVVAALRPRRRPEAPSAAA
jgi:hypothetical protein